MAKDPAFLFYPGDYLRDTQTLSEKSQVAYDRIMCEHMRNICITQQQLKFFTKRLSPEEMDELMFVLTELDEGYQIEWVAESIEKRRNYSESRRQNRKGSKKDKKNISKTYDKHMENEDVNEIEDKNSNVIYPFESEKFLNAWQIWKRYKKEQFKFTYKGDVSEQAALKKISSLSESNEETAIKIIYQSIENGWQGLFNVKEEHNKAVSEMDAYKRNLLNQIYNG